MSTETTLTQKWDAILNDEAHIPIKSNEVKSATARLLENAHAGTLDKLMLSEANEPTQSLTSGGTDLGYEPIMIRMLRRGFHKLIAHDVMGVQPMNTPSELIFAIKSRYGTPAGAEALFNEADTAHGGTGSHVGSDPFDPAYATGTPMPTAQGEGDNWQEMAFSIESVTAQAATRRLKGTYSTEMETDLQKIHGLSARQELSDIIGDELMAETNRELLRTIYSASKFGAQTTAVAGTFDVQTDGDGTWMNERFAGLVYAIERDANQVGIETRRGRGNILIASSDVVTALSMVGKLDQTSSLNINLMGDPAGMTFAGTIDNGRCKVYLDPYATGNFYVVGYRGVNKYDAGIIYAPYVYLEQYDAVDPETLQPVIGFKTRYDIVANPLTTLTANSNIYYRKAKVINLG